MEGGPVSERVDELSPVEERAALKLAPRHGVRGVAGVLSLPHS